MFDLLAGVPTAQSLPAWMLELGGLRHNDKDNVPVHLHLFRLGSIVVCPLSQL